MRSPGRRHGSAKTFPLFAAPSRGNTSPSKPLWAAVVAAAPGYDPHVLGAVCQATGDVRLYRELVPHRVGRLQGSDSLIGGRGMRVYGDSRASKSYRTRWCERLLTGGEEQLADSRVPLDETAGYPGRYRDIRRSLARSGLGTRTASPLGFGSKLGAEQIAESAKHRENRLPTSIMFSCGRSDEPLRSAVTVHRPGAKMFERRVVWHRLEPVSWRILRRSATGQALVRARVVFGELNFSLAMRGCRVSWCSCLRSLH